MSTIERKTGARNNHIRAQHHIPPIENVWTQLRARSVNWRAVSLGRTVLSFIQKYYISTGIKFSGATIPRIQLLSTTFSEYVQANKPK